MRRRIARVLRSLADRLNPLPEQPAPPQFFYTIDAPAAGPWPAGWVPQGQTCGACGRWSNGSHSCGSLVAAGA